MAQLVDFPPSDTLRPEQAIGEVAGLDDFELIAFIVVRDAAA